MKIPEPYKCDYCDRQKGEANHWWLFWPTDAMPGFFKVSTWDDVSAARDGVKHICSEQCALKALAKWLASIQVRGEAV